ncbi:MAG: hypothetical protein GXO62_03805 [Epsilonproteobacteria bacterium]|nr:hypothetical protein [Campylobacterota bacterium]
MKKTKIDDFLIEMIQPKIEEIEKKFTNNQPLSQDDINTLLLKSQYNHINHLDQKLDETVEFVKELDHRFSMLEMKFNRLEEKLTTDMKNLEEKLTTDMKSLEERLTKKIEITIQQALNKNMVLLITILGGFFTIIKIAEMFSK